MMTKLYLDAYRTLMEDETCRWILGFEIKEESVFERIKKYSVKAVNSYCSMIQYLCQRVTAKYIG